MTQHRTVRIAPNNLDLIKELIEKGDYDNVNQAANALIAACNVAMERREMSFKENLKCKQQVSQLLTTVESQQATVLLQQKTIAKLT